MLQFAALFPCLFFISGGKSKFSTGTLFPGVRVPHPKTNWKKRVGDGNAQEKPWEGVQQKVFLVGGGGEHQTDRATVMAVHKNPRDQPC